MWSIHPAFASLSGTTNWYIEYCFKNGIPQYAKYQVHGEVQSDNPPYENFKLCEIGTNYNRESPGFSTLNLNFIGNQGSHFIIVAKTVWWGSCTIYKSMFLQNGKE